MKVVKKQRKLAAIALALGVVACANSAQSFADDTDRMKRVFSNGVVEISEGLFNFTPSNINVDFTAPVSMLYMRAQAPFHEGTLDSLNAAQTQMNAGNKGETADSNRSFWASPYHSDFKGRNTTGADDLVSSEEFKMKRTGMMGGVEKQFTARTKAGFYMGYSWVGMSQDYAVHDHPEVGINNHKFHPEIDAVDFQFGGNFSHMFSNGWTVSTNLLGGAQHYSWSRLGEVDIEGTRFQELYQGGTTGNTLAVNVEVTKTFRLDGFWSLTPGFAIENANSWIWQGRESGKTYSASDFGLESGMPGCLGEDWEPWGLEDSVLLSRTTARFGASLAYSDNDWGFNAKAFYGTVLGDSARYGASNSGVRFSSSEVGAGYGNDSLSLGSGLWVALNDAKTTTLGGSYDARLYKRATSQTVSGTFVTRF